MIFTGNSLVSVNCCHKSLNYLHELYHIFFSATWLPGVQRIADRYLKNPVRVNVGSLDLQACHSVTQLVEFINMEDKQERVSIKERSVYKICVQFVDSY